MITTIKKSDFSQEDWESFIADPITRSYEEHRRGSNFFVRDVYELNEKWNPKHPELWGFWETDTFVWDTDYGSDDTINVLFRVERVEKQIITTRWEKL